MVFLFFYYFIMLYGPIPGQVISVIFKSWKSDWYSFFFNLLLKLLLGCKLTSFFLNLFLGFAWRELFGDTWHVLLVDSLLVGVLSGEAVLFKDLFSMFDELFPSFSSVHALDSFICIPLQSLGDVYEWWFWGMVVSVKALHADCIPLESYRSREFGPSIDFHCWWVWVEVVSKPIKPIKFRLVELVTGSRAGSLLWFFGLPSFRGLPSFVGFVFYFASLFIFLIEGGQWNMLFLDSSKGNFKSIIVTIFN